MKVPAHKAPPKSRWSALSPAKLSDDANDGFAKTIATIRQGYSKRCVAELAAKLHVTQDQLLHAVGLSPRTIRGRTDRLSLLETDRLVRLEQVFKKACEVFGTQAEAADWLTQPAYGFGGIKPLDLLDTEVGTREVFNLLGSIEWGQYY
jgi:putative toxin-antitoxin system antitoxin component (TIGR02293 family)